MCRVAGIEGYKTNHSLRATTCTIGLEKGVPEKLIMKRTGHRPVKSLHTYQRVSDAQKEIVSDVCKDQQLIFRGPQWKAMNHRLRKSANVRQKKTLLSLILGIVASYLIFPNKHL